MEMLSDQERNKLINKCFDSANKVFKLIDKFGNIRDINDNLKGRTTEERVKHLKRFRKKFPNIKEIQEPYLALFDEWLTVIKNRDVTYRKLHDQATPLDERMDELNVEKRELEKRLHEISPIADQISKQFLWIQEIAYRAMPFLIELEDLYNIEAEIMREIEESNPNPEPESQYDDIIKKIKWKASPDEFARQINALEKALYIQIIDGNITFIKDDPCQDVLSLFNYWFSTDKIIPKKRKSKDTDEREITYPHKTICRTFRYLQNGKLSTFTEGDLKQKRQLLDEQTFDFYKKNFDEIMKI